MISVIIPCWVRNARISQLMRRCVESIRKTCECEIILVDNGSIRDSDWMKDNADRYIRNKENLGFAVAVNQGISLSTGEYIAVMNDDIEVYEGWWQELMETCGDGISCATETIPGKDHERTTAFKQFDGYGALFMLSRKTYEELSINGKLLDEGYGIGMFEDRDLWGRAWEKGKKVVSANLCFVNHEGSATWKTIEDKEDIYRRNMQKFEDKWGRQSVTLDAKYVNVAPLKYAAYVIAYNEPRYIIPHLKQYPEWIEKIIVCVSTKPWFGEQSEGNLKMMDLLDLHDDPRVVVVKKHWNKEHDQRNWGAAMLYDYSWAITLDPDEFLTPEGWEKLKYSLDATLGDVAIAQRMTTYWKDCHTIWDEKTTHRPIIAMKPKKSTFWEKRETIETDRIEVPVEMHHLSWVKSDQEVKEKIANYSHSVDFDINRWYEDVWLKWQPGMFGLMPLKFPADVTSKPGELPESIRSLCCPEG